MNVQISHELKSLCVRMSDMESKVHSMDEKKSSVTISDTPSSSKMTEDVDDDLIL